MSVIHLQGHHQKIVFPMALVDPVSEIAVKRHKVYKDKAGVACSEMSNP
jgi:hypothetical protein